ncbi:MAG: DUF1015 family protein [Bifidobacteriaceae bacterium]|jgi:uncharacterized protein (DUF1015 family)|nr:DUF1015 family protein [Bifidobacteriaceae bacterium]
MVQVSPFRATLAKQDLVQNIVAPPYDVYDTAEAHQLGDSNPFSFVHIDHPEIDLDSQPTPDQKPSDCNYSTTDDGSYGDGASASIIENRPLPTKSAKLAQQSKLALDQFVSDGWLEETDVPHFYVYELTMEGRTQTGVVALVSAQDYICGKIKTHETTRAAVETEMAERIKTTGYQASSVYLAHQPVSGLDQVLSEIKTFPAQYDFVSFHNVRHRFWLVPNDYNEVLERIFETQIDSLYIMDGHHRAAAAVKVSPQGKFMATIFSLDQLKVWEYNRLVQSVPPANYLELLQRNFTLTNVSFEHAAPPAKHTIAMYYQRQWYHLRYFSHGQKSILAGGEAQKSIESDATGMKIVESTDILSNLDVEILQTQIFEPIFGITEPRTDPRLTFVGGIEPVSSLTDPVDADASNLAFWLYPTSISDVIAVADVGLDMPPKSTWFEPKLISGLFLVRQN